MDKTMSASEFKNTCLRVMDEVAATGQEIVVTKRGRKVVRVVPVRETEAGESLEGMILHQDDDLFSTGEEWSADA